MLAFLLTKLRAFRRDRRGNVAVTAALAMPVLLGSIGIGAEVASWYGGKRALQNAADSAAIAAATNGDPDLYDDEARAVAAQYGYRHGVDGVVVTASNAAFCPGGGNDCYQVTITRVRPLLLAQFVGFQGDAQLGGSAAKRVSASATAIRANGPREYCIVGLASSGHPEAIRSNGAPFADLSGCSVMSNSNATCNGHNLNADIGDAAGVNNNCGNQTNSHMDPIEDPYAHLASNIPADPCGGTYHTAPDKKKDPPLPSSNQLQGWYSSMSVHHICGDAELTGPTSITSTGDGAVLVIHNGGLDLNGYELSTMDGSALTIVFTGDDNTRLHAPFGDGAFDFKAPTTGPWKGVAMYQDPDLTGGVDIDEAGNEPTWNISGLVYLPHASVTFSGAVNKSSDGASCFVMVVDNIRINGTGSILAHGECEQAGLSMPASQIPSRGKLVL